MKHRISLRALALVLCVLFAAACFPVSASAEEAASSLSMTAGEVKQEFVPAGTSCTSSDTSVAWVDEQGNLNALKAGETTISDGTEEYKVTVEDYDDGSGVVGNLKILTRYNDSMPFYDGHVYLLFTSYQDGVEVNVDDLYAAYEISDQYYEDISKDISAGSNHTGNSADDYFTQTDDTSVTLNRGQIVTIGMYRDFDLNIYQAALGAITNSSAWSKLKSEGKAAIIKNIFSMLSSGKISLDDAKAKIKAVFDEVGTDYTKALNGVVDGGVCFNRELFNQKLEWDQYENVTYNLDITRNQLKTMTAYLGGNLNKFSMLKNSCATVALRAWNAAVGTRNGEATAYRLSAEGEGIYSVFDAPKSVRDNIRTRLPGYCTNNAQLVEEADAGFQDDTGWVYVSAPKKVSPVTYKYAEGKFVFEEETTNIPALFSAAKGDETVTYAVDKQEVGVKINTSEDGDYTSVDSIDFTVNGKTYTLNGDNAPDEGFWIMTPAEAPQEGSYYYAVQDDGDYLGTGYNDGYLSISLNTLPVKFKIGTGEYEEHNTLEYNVIDGEEANAVTEVYTKNNGEKTAIETGSEVEPGTKIYVKTAVGPENLTYILNDIQVNGESICDSEHFDAEEGAYAFNMSEGYVSLFVEYSEAEMKQTGKSPIQLVKGDELKALDLVTAEVYGEPVSSDKIACAIVDDADNALTLDGNTVKASAEGTANVWVHMKSNENIGVLITVEVVDSIDSMAKITFDEKTSDKLDILIADGETALPYSGYLVKKGTELKFAPAQTDGTVVLSLTANGKDVPAGESFTVNEDTEIEVKFAEATVKGIPKKIVLDAEDNSYQLDAKIAYSGTNALRPVYDSSVRYESSDPLVAVDEKGLITLTGDIPEDGAAVIVTAYAGSSNDMVSAQCKVIVGNYQGDRIVGRLTIHARSIVKEELTPHGCITFTTYEDADFDASYFEFNKPSSKYTELMLDYENNPEKYDHDPALYNDNELKLENRDEDYFDTDNRGVGSEPVKISLKAGESFSVSNYSFDNTHMETVLAILEDSTISASPQAQELIRQIKKFTVGEEIDTDSAFDSFVATLVQAYGYARMTGKNPADGKKSNGGLTFDREMFNQFRRNDKQTPNNYYSVDITADELAALKAYVANPDNNYYSLFVMNCASGAVDIWNTTLADRPELAVKGNYTGFTVEPESLYFELGTMRLKNGLDGKGGTNFYPRCVPFTDEEKAVITKIADIGKVKNTEECGKKIEDALNAYNALNDVQKERIRNFDTLKDAKEKFDSFNKDAEKEPAAPSFDTDKVQFNIHKAVNAFKVLGLVKSGDSEACVQLVSNAEKAILALEYDKNKTLDENKAAVDGILAQLAADLENQRKAETEPEVEEPTQPEKTIAPSRVNFSKKPDLSSAVNALKKAKSDSDPKGSKFSKLKAKASRVTKTSNKITWSKVTGAKKYVVLGNKCGKTNHFKKLKTTTAKSYTQKKLKKNTNYKYIVLAVNSENKVISASKIVHTATKGGKKTNYKSIAINKTKKTLKKGKTFTLKVTEKTKQNSKGKITTHRKIRYESANTKIATVTSKGKIKAVKKGTTYIYAYAQNGVYKRIKITVK